MEKDDIMPDFGFNLKEVSKAVKYASKEDEKKVLEIINKAKEENNDYPFLECNYTILTDK